MVCKFSSNEAQELYSCLNKLLLLVIDILVIFEENAPKLGPIQVAELNRSQNMILLRMNNF